MKTEFIALLLTIALFFGCKSHKPSENKETIVKSQVDTIISIDPPKYQEEIIDSLLDVDNDIRLIIKISTRMDKSVSKVYVRDSTHIEKLVYRDNSISFKLLVNNTIKLDTTITKESLPQIGDEEFLKQSTMHRAWIKRYDKENQTIYTRFNVTVPDTDWAYSFMMITDKDGICRIELEEIE